MLFSLAAVAPSASERFSVDTDDRLTTVDVTDRVAAAVPDGASGVCTAFVRHTTAALVVQENESRLRGDVESFLGDLVPDEGHAHDRPDGNSVERRSTGSAVYPQNADSHLRATMLGPSVSVPVTDGDLELGTWQSIYCRL